MAQMILTKKNDDENIYLKGLEKFVFTVSIELVLKSAREKVGWRQNGWTKSINKCNLHEISSHKLVLHFSYGCVIL